ncbi:MAG: PAS-domain containing protein [Planctomycetales bacterium]
MNGQSIQGSQQFYKDIPVGLCHVDRDLQIVDINQWLADLSDHPANRLLGQKFGSLFSAIAEQVEPALRQVLESGTPIRDKMIHADAHSQAGIRRTFKTSFLPVQGEDDTIDGVSCVFDDVTESHSMPLVLTTLAEEIGLAITVWDKDLRLLVANEIAEQMLEFPVGTLVPGVTMECCFRILAERGEYGEGVNVDEQVRQRLDLARKFEPHFFERTCANGSVLEVRGAPMPDGGFVSIHFDITDRKRADNELRKNETRLREAQKVAQIGSFEGDIYSDKLWWSDELYRLFGLEPAHFSPTKDNVTPT